MKKITMWLFLLVGFISYSQINISQDFPTTTTPAGWGLGGGSLTTTQPCASASWRFNVYSSSSTTTNALSTETFVSTGEQLNVSFDYKIVDWSAATVATTPYNGTITVETSSDNGATYGNAVVAVNNGNHTVANTCATKSVVIPGSSAPGGANTKIRFKCTFGTSGDYYVYLDNVVITQAAAPACTGTPAPGNTLFPSSICAGSSATLSLQNYTPGAGVTYQWYMNAVAIGGATNISYVIPSVTSSNSYYCEVTCAGNTTASSTVVVGPVILNAPTGIQTFATYLPTCWLFGDNGDLSAGPATYGSNSWKNDGFGNVGSSGSIAYNHFTTGANDWIISPVINVPASGYELKFDASLTQWNGTGAPTTPWDAGDVLEVLISTTGLDNWSAIYTIDNSNAPNPTGSNITVDLDLYAGQNVRIAYRVVSGATDGADDTDIFVDNFEIRLSPTCPDMTGLTAGIITSSTADFSWDPLGTVGYQYAVTTSATPPASGTFTSGTIYSASSLLPQTVYYLHVRAECAGSTYGNWATLSFVTACAPITDFNENFNSVTTPALPSCWSKILSGASSFATVGTSTVNASAPNGVNLYNSDSAATANIMLVSPMLSNLSAGTHRLKFKARNNSDTQDLEIGVLTNPADATTFTLVEAVDINTTFQNYIVNFDVFTGPGSVIAFRRLSTSTYTNVYLDDIIWEAIPSCPDQTGVVFSGVTPNSANTSWDPIVGAAGYEYAVTTSATPPASGTSTTSTVYAATSLTSDTLYYIHVRPMCSPGVYGNWASASFYTGYCLPSSTNNTSYVNNFSTTGGSQNISNLATGFTTGGYLNASAQFVEGYATSSFSFNGAIVGPTVGFAIWIDWNNDMVFDNTTEKVYNTTSYGNGPFTGTISIPAGTAIGNYRMRVVTDYNASNPSNPCAAVTRGEFEDYTVSVIAPPACVPPVPSAGSVTDATANLTWAAVPSAAVGYEYVLNNVATDPAGSGTSTVALTYPASGLTQLTTYYFHLRSVCSAGTYSAWSTVSFTTLATPPVNDNCSGALVLTPGATFSANPLIATNVGATNSAPTPAPTCGSFDGGDVWYTVTVPASGNITIETQANAGSPVNDTQFTVYSGTCGTFTQVGCDDEGGISSFSLLAITGRTPGEILYVHAYIYDNSQTGTYQISAYDASLSSDSFDKSAFVAYPNPVKDVLNLSYRTAISNVRVVNLLGQEVLNNKTNTNDVKVNMSALTAGAYIVNITVEDTVHTIKVIKE